MVIEYGANNNWGRWLACTKSFLDAIFGFPLFIFFFLLHAHMKSTEKTWLIWVMITLWRNPHGKNDWIFQEVATTYHLSKSIALIMQCPKHATAAYWCFSWPKRWKPRNKHTTIHENHFKMLWYGLDLGLYLSVVRRQETSIIGALHATAKPQKIKRLISTR